MADLGTDIMCLHGLGKVFVLASGRKNLALAIARRYRTRRGGLFYDPNYGYPLTLLLSAELTDGAVQAIGPSLAQEALKDERVLACEVDFQYDRTTKTATIRCSLTDADGPFVLILKANAVTVEILEIQG